MIDNAQNEYRSKIRGTAEGKSGTDVPLRGTPAFSGKLWHDHSRSVVTSRTVLRSINSHPQDTYTLERSIIALGEARLPRCSNAFTLELHEDNRARENKKKG